MLLVSTEQLPWNNMAVSKGVVMFILSLIVPGTKPLHMLCLVPGMPLLLGFFFFFFKFNFLFLATLGLSCGVWDLVPCPGTEPLLPSLGVRSLSHWTTGGVHPPSLPLTNLNSSLYVFTQSTNAF